MITFYATMSCDHMRPYMADVPVMLPASSWARVKMRAPKLPHHVRHAAADCGGFVATKVWGDYRYSPQEYVDWLDTFRPKWAATMDYCCEDEITSGKPGIVRERQTLTTHMAWYFWLYYRDAPWAWAPTVQGWQTEDYRRHARELKPLISIMQAFYKSDAFRVGIGTLCARASTHMVHQVVQAVAAELPGVPLHLWGVKLGVLKSRVALPQVVSVDSAAWDQGGMYRDGLRTLEEQRALGMKQKEYAHKIALPRYLAKVEAALAQPKQMPLI